jgi:hypothetical protein
MITRLLTVECDACQKAVEVTAVRCPNCTSNMPKHALEGSGPSTGDLTIRELQTQLPWTVHYHHDFRSSAMTHKDFGHALLHIQKAAGKIAAVVNDAEHGGSEFLPDEVDRYVADLVVCALRMANTCPGRTIDLQRAVEDRIERKNEAELRREKQ